MGRLPATIIDRCSSALYSRTVLSSHEAELVKMVEWLIVQAGKAAVAVLGAGLTTFIANEMFDASWDFWLVLIVWLLMVFLGILVIGELGD